MALVEAFSSNGVIRPAEGKIVLLLRGRGTIYQNEMNTNLSVNTDDFDKTLRPILTNTYYLNGAGSQWYQWEELN